MNKISVIVPSYNVESYIDKSFKSLLNQTFKEFEIIVINDGSKDNTLEKLKFYESIDSRVKVIDKANEGVGATRNLGLHLAKGEYIIFVDPDDSLHSDMLQLLYEKALETSANVIVCEHYVCYEQSDAMTVMPIEVKSSELLFVKERKDLIFQLNPAPWNKLIKVSWLKEMKIEFPLDYRSEDLTFTTKVLARCQTVAIVHHPLYYYLANRIDNVSSANDERILHTLQALQDILISYEHWNLKEEFKAELEMLTIKQIQYELHKVIYLEDKKLANQVIYEFFKFLKINFPDWKKNKYYRSIYQKLNLINKYRIWIYEKPGRLKMYYDIRQVRRLFK
ncbi:MAG: glycosyltransferase [Turicibacter sp.]|nr:glycosyltransferase [Turicibacter sp.]